MSLQHELVSSLHVADIHRSMSVQHALVSSLHVANIHRSMSVQHAVVSSLHVAEGLFVGARSGTMLHFLGHRPHVSVTPFLLLLQN